MTVPNRPAPTIQVVCYACTKVVAEGDDIADGQPLLTKYADASCTRTHCPNKTEAVETARRHRALSQDGLLDLARRVEALERERRPQ